MYMSDLSISCFDSTERVAGICFATVEYKT